MNRILPIAAAAASFLISACSGSAGGPANAADGVKENGQAEVGAIICPDTLPAVDLDNAPEYDSWLAIKAPLNGHVVREWLNGCAQQLTFPPPAEQNAPYNEGQADFKPTHSPDAGRITFFRRVFSMEPAGDQHLDQVTDSDAGNWLSKIMIMDEDGSDQRDLTGTDYPNYNPMWSRKQYADGYRVSFSRGYRDGAGIEVCWTSENGVPGEESCFTDRFLHGGVFGYSHLRDGRILVRLDSTLELALATPGATPEATVFEPITYLDGSSPMPVLQKISISRDEKRIAYAKTEGQPQDSIYGAVTLGRALIAVADFDAKTRTISNEKILSEGVNEVNLEWYVSWSRNNQQIVWNCSGNCVYWSPTVPVQWYNQNSQVVEHDFATGITRRISVDHDANYRYPSIWGSVK